MAKDTREEQRLKELNQRNKLTAKINETLANLHLAQQRVEQAEEHLCKVVNDAKSNLGTALKEQEKICAEYHHLRQRLLSLIPEFVLDEERAKPSNDSSPAMSLGEETTISASS